MLCELLCELGCVVALLPYFEWGGKAAHHWKCKSCLTVSILYCFLCNSKSYWSVKKTMWYLKPGYSCFKKMFLPFIFLTEYLLSWQRRSALVVSVVCKKYTASRCGLCVLLLPITVLLFFLIQCLRMSAWFQEWELSLFVQFSEVHYQLWRGKFEEGNKVKICVKDVFFNCLCAFSNNVYRNGSIHHLAYTSVPYFPQCAVTRWLCYGWRQYCSWWDIEK